MIKTFTVLLAYPCPGEIGSGTRRSQGNIALDLKETHVQFARLHLNNKGPIRHRAAA